MAREHYNCSNLAGVFVEETSRYVCKCVCVYMFVNKTIPFVEQFTLGSSYSPP